MPAGRGGSLRPGAPSRRAAMKIGLFVPCYVDQLLPRVGMATLAVLERLGLDVEFPEEQTCCGQPMANAGLAREAAPLAERFLRVFAPFDAVCRGCAGATTPACARP